MNVALHNSHLKVVEVLLKHNAAVNQQDYMGWAALHKASSSGHLKVSRVLLEFGADVNPSQKCVKRYRMITNEINCLI